VKAGNIFVGLAQLELFDDVVTHSLRGASGESRNGPVGKVCAERAHLPVLRAKLVSPF